MHIIDSMWDSPDERSQCEGANSPPPPEDNKLKEANANGDAVKPKPNMADITP